MNFEDKMKQAADKAQHQTVQGVAKAATPAAAPEFAEGMSFADKMKQASSEAKHETVQGVGQSANHAPAVKSTGQMTTAAFADKLKAVQNTKLGAEEMETEFETGLVAKWSFSGLKAHEGCQWYTQLNKVDKVPQESGPQAARGSDVHDGCEEWVRGKRKQLPSDPKTRFDAFTDEFTNLKREFIDGRVTLEDKWGVRKDWSPCDWDDEEIWGRGALDAFFIEVSGLLEGERVHFVGGKLVFSDGDGSVDLEQYLMDNPEKEASLDITCRIIDYKTGRKYGNEMKHADQGLCYGLHAFHRFPMVTTFQVEFWYIDQGQKTIRSFNRKQLDLLLPRYHNRAKAMTTVMVFRPSPNVHTCRFCSYGSNRAKDGRQYGNGACAYDAYRGMNDE
jgi:hypothetical protein